MCFRDAMLELLVNRWMLTISTFPRILEQWRLRGQISREDSDINYKGIHIWRWLKKTEYPFNPTIIPEKHTTGEEMTIVYLVNVQILLQGNERQFWKIEMILLRCYMRRGSELLINIGSFIDISRKWLVNEVEELITH